MALIRQPRADVNESPLHHRGSARTGWGRHTRAGAPSGPGSRPERWWSALASWTRERTCSLPYTDW